MTVPDEDQGRPPGWHPDPEDPASLRHWDGRRWGGERRPRPPWAPPAPPATARAGSRRRWALIAAGAVAMAAAVSLAGAALSSGPDIPPRTVEDRSFTEQAQRRCVQVLTPLRDARPAPGPEGAGTTAKVLAQVERATVGIGRLVADLRALPLARADEAGVDRWLDDWDRYLAVGRRYAATLRTGKTGEAASVGSEGDPISRRIFVFARANGMRACTP